MKALVAILGLDSHWRGSVMVARILRDAGLEIVYLGNQFPEQLVAQALQEDPDLIAVSSLSGSHRTLVPELMRLLVARGVDAPVLVGGAIPPQDIPVLRQAGVAQVFPPGRPLDDLTAFVRGLEAGERGRVASQ
ncbi:MAG: cobalamin B12-binding domain-containing protein [Candidatus Rokuibacteriota bacterium]